MRRSAVQRMSAKKLARGNNQSLCRGVLPVGYRCCQKFFKHVHNLFTHALWSFSPAGLRLEISYESDKKKMNFIFNYDQKIFLTGKMKCERRRQNEKQVVGKIS